MFLFFPLCLPSYNIFFLPEHSSGVVWVCVCSCVCILAPGPSHKLAPRLWWGRPGPPGEFPPWSFRINHDPGCLGLSAHSDSSLMAAHRLLLPPPFGRDANQPPASCLVGADSISQGARLLPEPFIKSAGAAGDLREGAAGKRAGRSVSWEGEGEE